MAAADAARNSNFNAPTTAYVQRMTHFLRAAGVMYQVYVKRDNKDRIVDTVSLIEEIVSDWAPLQPGRALQAISDLVKEVGFSQLLNS